MPAVLLDYSGDPVPRFASFLATRIPLAFLQGVRPLVNSACDQGFREQPPRHDSELPYWKNIQPHVRNSLAFERLHRLAEDTGMSATAKKLNNDYQYLEIQSGGLVIHVKHQNNYQSLSEQITKAEYRRQLASINTGFGQLSLAYNEWPLQVPDRAFVILFYQDGQNKSVAGNIFFILPDREDEQNMANCDLDEVIAAHGPTKSHREHGPDDVIDLPPKDSDDEGKVEGK